MRELWIDTWVSVDAGSVSSWRPAPELYLKFAGIRKVVLDLELTVVTVAPSLEINLERTAGDGDSYNGLLWQEMLAADVTVTTTGKSRQQITVGIDGTFGDLAPRGFGRLAVTAASGSAIVRVRCFATLD